MSCVVRQVIILLCISASWRIDVAAKQCLCITAIWHMLSSHSACKIY